MNPTVFREYDIRGVVDQDITVDDVCRLGRAWGTYLRRQGRDTAVLGYDTRASSPAFRDAMTEGLVATGIHVVDIGTVTTPIFYWSRIHLGIDGGVMITASHNPAEFNGFKLALGPATLYGREIQAVRALMEAGTFADGSGSVRREDPVPAYLAMLRDKIRLGPRRLRVVVDTGNGTASLFAEDIFRGWGCETIGLFTTPDPTFPHHHPDPVVAKNLTDLIRAVRAEGADVGIAFDGDGDRIGVVDETGRIIWGDRLMILYWREILPRYPGTRAIVEVKCSKTLIDEIERLGGRPEFYKTGHSLIKARMREIGAVFTGEMSGHMFFADEYYGFDDAFYAAGRLLRILSHTDRPLSALLADVPELAATPEVRIPCPDDQKFAVVDRLVAHFRARYPVVDVDGVRVNYPYGWGLVRASNTQPALVARAEADTVEHLRGIEADIEEALASVLPGQSIDWTGE
ncbi:MAG: phosphomannomutase/phosphoglucomutase [Actinomycetia bacterium]|nr:phosphomannomutase/phosphoglucomutase [Actinomycetes bacterium]